MLTEFCQDYSLVIVNPSSNSTREDYTWTSPDSQYRNQIDSILCSQRWRSSIQSAKTRPRADCGLDHELLTAKFRLKLKKVGKTTRPFSSVHFSLSVMSISFGPHGLQYARVPSFTISQSLLKLMSISQ